MIKGLAILLRVETSVHSLSVNYNIIKQMDMFFWKYSGIYHLLACCISVRCKKYNSQILYCTRTTYIE